MTDKQKRFADEYLIDCNATRAYKAAYPRVKSDDVANAAGARLLANVKVKAYIEQKMEELSSSKIATAEEVIQFLTSVMRSDYDEETLAFVGDGIQEKTHIKISSKDRLKAAELLGKRYGIFSDKLNIEGTMPVMIVDDLDES